MRATKKFNFTLCFLILSIFVIAASPVLPRYSPSPPSSETEPIAEWGTGEPVSLSYSSDSSLLAVATAQGYILVFETQNYNLVQTIHTGMVLGFATGYNEDSFAGRGSVAISPDNRFVGVTAVDDSVGIWEIKNGKSKFINWGEQHGKYKDSYYSGWVKNTYFLGKGEIFVVQSSYEKYRFYRTEDGAELAIGNLPINPGFKSSNSPDLHFIVGTPGAGGGWHLQRTTDWLLWRRIRQVWNDSLIQVGQSYSGNYILRKSSDGIEIWDIQSSQNLFTFPFTKKWGGFSAADNSWAVFTSFSKDSSSFIIFQPYDKGQLYLASLWDIASQSKTGEFLIPYHPSQMADINSLGSQIAYPVPGGIEIVNLPSGKINKTILFGTCAGKIEISPNGKLIASYFGRAIYICQSSDGKLLRYINVPTSNVTDIDWSPDSRYVASSGTMGYPYTAYDSKIHLWDVRTGDEIKSFDGATGDIGAIAISPDGELIAGFSGILHAFNFPVVGNEIIVWRISDGKIIGNYDPIAKVAYQIAFASNSRLVVSSRDYRSSQPRKVWLMNLPQGYSVGVVEAYSPSFQLLKNGNLATRNDQAIQIWNISGNSPSLINSYAYAGWSYLPPVISPDGEKVVSFKINEVVSNQYITSNRDVILEKLDGTAKIALLQEKADYRFGPLSVAFSPDGQTVLIAPFELAGVIKVFSASGIQNMVEETLPAILPIYDDFSGTALNSKLWQLSDLNSASNSIFEVKDGTLIAHMDEKPAQTYIELLGQNTFLTGNDLKGVEAQFKIPQRSDGSWSFATLKVASDNWSTQCWLTGLPTSNPSFGCSVTTYSGNNENKYESRSTNVKFNQWYTLRIEIDPLQDSISWFLDGNLIDYKLLSSQQITNSRIAPALTFWTDKDSTLLINIDNVRITR